MTQISNNPCTNNNPDILSIPLDQLNPQLEDLYPSNLNKVNKSQLTRWFYPKNSPRAYALVTHGLNNTPTAMDDLSNFLAKIDIQVLRLTLPGHHGNIEEMKNINHQEIQKQIYLANALLQKTKPNQDTPSYFVGNSFGALSFIDTLLADTQQTFNYKKFIFLAPAFTPKPIVKLVRLFKIFGGNYIVNSFSHEKFRANRGTSVNAYETLFKMAKNLAQMNLKKTQHIPSMIYLDPKDELIGQKQLNDFIESKNLKKWKVNLITGRVNLKPKGIYHHQVFNKFSLGDKNWNKLIRETTSFLTLK